MSTIKIKIIAINSSKILRAMLNSNNNNNSSVIIMTTKLYLYYGLDIVIVGKKYFKYWFFKIRSASV